MTAFADVCHDITGVDMPTALDAFADWFNNKLHANDDCAEADPQVFIDWLREDDWEAEWVQKGARQLFYQECTELGLFMTTDSDLQPFGNRVGLDMWTDLCQEVFGEWITFESIYYATQRSNNRFGALNPRVNFIHFTNGAENPVRRVAILNDLNTEALSDVIPNEMFGSDTRAISENDSEELQAVKRRLKALLSYYLFPHGPRETPVEN